MATLKIKASEPIGETLRLLHQGVISEDQWQALVSSWESKGGYSSRLEDLTLRHYGRLIAAKSDEEAVLIQFNATSMAYFSSPEDIPSGKYLDILVGLKEDMARIDNAFKTLPKAGLTPEEIEAGFDKLDFGLFGIIDTLACRQGLTDEQVKDMRLGDAIGKLAIIGKRAQAERRLADIRASKANRIR